MDRLAALKLQIEWGADEAIADAPVDRLRAVATPAPSPATPVATANATPTAARAAALAAAADTTEALLAALEAFDGCGLRDTAASLVFAEGDPASRVMLVGDAPGEAEERAGRPFAGPAGALLDRMLASIGLERNRVLIGMAVPWRPPGGRPATDAELACCLPFLHRQIALVRPRRLLLLGPTATRALAPGVRRPTRGTWLDVIVPGVHAPVPGLLTASPAAVLAKPSERRRAWADLRLLRRAMDADLSDS